MLDLMLMAETDILAESVQSRPLEAVVVELENEIYRQFTRTKATVRALVDSPMLDAIARTAFGGKATVAQLASTIERFDREGWPRLRIADLRGARGAYIKTTDTIYLCCRMVSQGVSCLIQDTLLHEIGHAIDHRLQGPEAPGDEGAIFAAMAAGGTLGAGTLEALRRTDDQGVIVVDGQLLHAEFASTYGRITVDGGFSDWLSTDRIDISANTVSGYNLYGTFAAGNYLVGIQATSTSDVVVGPGTTIWLNTDGNRTTGYNLAWGFTNVGAEYNVTFDSTGTPYLYTGGAGATKVSTTKLTYAKSADGKSLEIAIPQSLLTPAGGTAPGSISLAAEINGSVFLPGDYSTKVPEYTIKAPAPAQTYGSVTVDGSLSEWTSAQRIDTAANPVSGYSLYGTVAANTYVIALQSTSSSDPVIGAGTTIWLNTDQNRLTGYNLPWGFTNVGAEYNITFDAYGTPYLYTGAAGQTLANPAPLNYALSADGKSLEIAIPRALITPSGGTAPGSVDMEAVINGSVYVPGDFSTKVPEYTIKSAAPPQTFGSVTVDGSFSDWTSAQRIDTAANPVTGYSLYGTVAANTYLIGLQSTSTSDPVIGPGTTIWLNTDQNRLTGYNLPWGFTNVGAEYNITFDSYGTPYLYTGSAGQTLASPAPLTYALSADGKSLEIAIPRALITPSGGTAPSSINMEALINGSVYVPGDFSTKVPEYTIKDPAAAPKAYGSITVDGAFTDWTSAQRIDGAPGDAVPGYALYGTAAAGSYLIGIQSTATTDSAIGPGTTIWLDTDLNRTTGYNLWGGTNVGAEYNITFDSSGTPYLYTGSAGQTLVGGAPLNWALSSDGKSLEIAIPEALLAPSGGTAPTTISMSGQIAAAGSPSTVTYLPGDFTSPPQYQITDPASLSAKPELHKVAIIYSDTSAARYFSQTAYDDLFMAAQNQARMAGVSYDILDESQLTNVNNLIKYDELIFPSMTNVNTAQLPQIMSALTSAVNNYHIGIITAGDFLTNDQNGAALPGNAYANMQSLLNLTRSTGGTGSTVTVTASDVANPIMQGYTAGQTITSYTNESYEGYQTVSGTDDVLVNQNVSGVGTVPGVVQTTTGGTNVHFATTDLLGDSNLLSHAIQSTVLGTQAGVTLHTSRQAGILAARIDMDQSQYPSDVSPSGGSGIYDKLIPILTQWNQQYNFVGSFYINIGDDPNGETENSTNWAVSLPDYKKIQSLGNEIGNHSYTHLVNPPSAPIAETTTAAAAAGSTQITLNTLPSFAGATVGMFVSGAGIGAGTQITAVSGNTITISYMPGGYGTANVGTTAAIAAGATLKFTVPEENTNFLQTGTTGVNSAAGHPFTFDYEFNQSKTLEQQQLGTTVYGAAVPGAPETIQTAENILQYYPSGTGYEGYVSGGWTGIGAGYPNAFGYIDPTHESAVYIAPNMTFDFTEIEYEHKTVAQASADWTAQFNQLTANAPGTPVVVWPFHDYGAAAWDTSGTGAASPYTTQMFTNFIAQASSANFESVTTEDLAERIAAQQKATINYTTVGNTITATASPDPSAADLGVMALAVSPGQSIASVSNWYAYNSSEVFLPDSGGTYTINLGTTPADVTHITNLPSRDHLLSLAETVMGSTKDLAFGLNGGDSGQITVQMQTGASNIAVTGASVASQTGSQLLLNLPTTSSSYNVDLKWT